MGNFLNFFQTLMTGFSNFSNWFFFENIGGLNIYPYMLFGFGGLLLILGLHVFKLLNPVS